MNETGRRLARKAFIERALKAGQEARETGIYHSSDYVLGELDEIAAKAEAREGDH